ncbi:hypothetical protein ACFLRZ_01995 [Bacteroidota bacterium]
MKRILLAILIVFCAVTFINAQGLTSKKGIPILPQKGDYALGVNATPFLNYLGNFMNGNTNNTNTVNFSFVSNSVNTIYGKYFLEDDKAVRVNFRFGKITETQKVFIMKDISPVPVPPVLPTEEVVEDSWKNSQTIIALSGGLEKRRGHGRVQGIYGGDIGIIFMSEKNTYEYGNPINADYPSPDRTSFNFGDNYVGTNFIGNDEWITECKEGSVFGFSIRGFVGVEYFFAPKISIGGEFGWGIGFYSMGEGEQTSESWNITTITTPPQNPYLVEKTTKEAGGSTFRIDTDNLNGVVIILFYF